MIFLLLHEINASILWITFHKASFGHFMGLLSELKTTLRKHFEHMKLDCKLFCLIFNQFSTQT